MIKFFGQRAESLNDNAKEELQLTLQKGKYYLYYYGAKQTYLKRIYPEDYFEGFSNWLIGAENTNGCFELIRLGKFYFLS